ncbi:hypothetical protein Z043_110268, partial [Scleropages formosus]
CFLRDFFRSQSVASADMDQVQLEAFLTAQTRKQGGGGLSTEQAAALSKFWRSQRPRIRESLLGQSRWEPCLRGVSWRVDLQTSTSRGEPASSPVALVELELGRTGKDKMLRPMRSYQRLYARPSCTDLATLRMKRKRQETPSSISTARR